MRSHHKIDIWFSDPMTPTGMKLNINRYFKCVVSIIAATSIFGGTTYARERPNILLVLLDDVGYTDFGAYGGVINTPSIDAVAANGALFSRYYTSPQCGPSRAMLLTGMDNHQVGMGSIVEVTTEEIRQNPGYSMIWNKDQQTIASKLLEAGYQTYVTGKWGIGKVGANLPNNFGFTRSFVMDATGGSNYDEGHYLPGYDNVDWYEDGKRTSLPTDYYSSRTLVDKLIDYIDEGSSESPFFAYLSLQALHIPVQAPAEYIERYDDVFNDGWDAMRVQRFNKTVEAGLIPASTELASVPDSHRAWNDLTEQEKQLATRSVQVNAGMMEAADFHIGRLLNHLDEKTLLDNTIVVITSDNGPESGVMGNEPGLQGTVMNFLRKVEGFDTSPENMGGPNSLTAMGPEWASVAAAPFHLYKFTAGEGGLRVPLVIAGPGITAGSIHKARAHVSDLTPTLLDAVGVEFDANRFYGRSLMKVLKGQAEEAYGPEDATGFEVSGNAALYRANWKLVRVSLPHGDSQWRLFDIVKDPGETTDLAAKEPALFEELLNEYQIYSNNVGVVELSADASSTKQLGKNLMKKVLNKYWPYILLMVLAISGFLYVVVRALTRRKTALV